MEIARRFNGEIINADAMQLYQGLPVITNKITEDEMKGVPHHLLGCIGLEEETWTVGKFVANALRVVSHSKNSSQKVAETVEIDEIRSRGKLPVLVGGTHYYTQALLFKDALADTPVIKNGDEQHKVFPILEGPTEVILQKLREVDPVMAERWHPNERRKIRRSLEIYLQTGKPASQIYDEQRINRDLSSGDGDGVGGLRFPTVMFWVHASKDILYARLDSRVDKMLENGLLSEVQTLHDFRTSLEERTRQPVDQSRGIWVSIGYKEFLDYEMSLSNLSINDKERERLMTQAVEKTQAATRQYAKRQVKWIQIKLLNALLTAGQGGTLFLADSSDMSKWDTEVLKPSIKTVGQFLSGQKLPDPRAMSDAAREMLTPRRNYDLSQRPDLWQQKICETCGTIAVTENEWNLHIKSRAHRRAVGVRKKHEAQKEVRHEKSRTRQEDGTDVLGSYMPTFPDESDK